MARDRFRDFLRDGSGASAIEMALLAPAFVALLLAVVQGSLLVFTQASLHYAVQKGVRCAALMDSCPSPGSYYLAPGSAPVFTPALLTCGRALTATVSYNLSLLVYQRNVSLSATACFPDLKSTAS